MKNKKLWGGGSLNLEWYRCSWLASISGETPALGQPFFPLCSSFTLQWYQLWFSPFSMRSVCHPAMLHALPHQWATVEPMYGGRWGDSRLGPRYLGPHGHFTFHPLHTLSTSHSSHRHLFAGQMCISSVPLLDVKNVTAEKWLQIVRVCFCGCVLRPYEKCWLLCLLWGWGNCPHFEVIMENGSVKIMNVLKKEWWERDHNFCPKMRIIFCKQVYLSRMLLSRFVWTLG